MQKARQHAPTTPPPPAPASPLPAIHAGVNIAAFMADTLMPSAHLENRIPLTKMWQAYQSWCTAGNAVPIAYPEFVERLHAVATDVGIEVYQRGSHRQYLYVRWKDPK